MGIAIVTLQSETGNKQVEDMILQKNRLIRERFDGRISISGKGGVIHAD